MAGNFEAIAESDKKFLANTYNRLPVAIVRGKGAKLWDTEGREYVDCMAGIASVSLGHSNPKIAKTMKVQAKKLMHVSNWVYTDEGPACAEKLVNACGIGGKAFFCNSGAEAVEAALKLARKATGKPGILAMENAFHGRTMGALSLTYGEKYKKPFEPLLPGVKHVPFNDLGAVANVLAEDRAIGAVIVEPIQGEAGVVMPDADYLKGLRKICDEKNVLLIFDEIQTGFCRTGTFLAWQNEKYGAKPDVLCLGKAIANGLPMGAMVASETVIGAFGFSDHGTTFGGNPFCVSVANTVLEIMVAKKMGKKAARLGKYFMKKLKEIPGAEVRGCGLLIAIASSNPRRSCESLLQKGVLAIPTGQTSIRFVPPLVISKQEIDKVVAAVAEIRKQG